MRELYGVREGLAEGYKVLSHVPDPGLEDLGPPLVVLGILCCHTCWLGDFGALGLPGASDEGIVVGRWHSRLLSRTAWHPGPCWSRGSGWGGRDGEARQGVRGLHALQTGQLVIVWAVSPPFIFPESLKRDQRTEEALGNLGVLAPPLLPLALSAPPITTQRRLPARNEDRKQSSLAATPASGFKPCS